jgi:sulfate permease, SulP family
VGKERSAIRAPRVTLPVDPIPFHSAIRGLRRQCLAGDLNAALNVALLAFPQGMAYALIAGLPLQYGIFGSAVASIVGTAFARSHFVALGPTNATSVLLLSAFAAFQIGPEEKLVVLPLIVLLSGLFLIIGSLGRVASLIQYISRSVITGYITAAALLIISNQASNVLGIRTDPGAALSTFVQITYHTFACIASIDINTLAISVLTVLIYMLLNRYLPHFPTVAITLVTVSVLTWAFGLLGFEVGKLQSIQLQEWRVTVPVLDAHQIRLMAGTSLAIAILSLLEASSIGKTLAARSGTKLDTDQEMFNMGMSNVACAFLSGLPASGSLTRSMLNWKSGARSPMASLYTGLLILLAAALLGPFVSHIPKAALAVVVISIGLSLINRHHIFIVTHSTGSDKLVFYLTLGSGLLLPLDMAIVLGTGVSIYLFLKKAARPEMVEYTFTDEGHLMERQVRKEEKLEISIVHVEGDLFFGSADLFRDQIRRVFEEKNLKILVLRLKNAHNLDATCVLALEELINYMQEKERHLIISGVRPKIYRTLEGSGMVKRVGVENVFREDPDNPTFSTAQAMRRAKQILGGREANVTIYVKPETKPEGGAT